jgi:hypothetical protein
MEYEYTFKERTLDLKMFRTYISLILALCLLSLLVIHLELRILRIDFEDVPLQPPGFHIGSTLGIDIKDSYQEYRLVDNDIFQGVNESPSSSKAFKELVKRKWWNMKYMINEITEE